MSTTGAASTNESWYNKQKELLPVLSKVMAVVILVVNILLPGVGTMILACIGPSFAKEHLIIGLVQLLLSFLIIGWVWSILWGILLLLKSAN